MSDTNDLGAGETKEAFQARKNLIEIREALESACYKLQAATAAHDHEKAATVREEIAELQARENCALSEVLQHREIWLREHLQFLAERTRSARVELGDVRRQLTH